MKTASPRRRFVLRFLAGFDGEKNTTH
jgi:hypothetical protein